VIGFKFNLLMDPKPLQKATDKGAYKSFGHAAASIRKTGRASIKKRPKTTVVSTTGPQTRDKRGKFKKRKRKRRVQVASPPGSAPYTGRGQLKNAIVFQATKSGAVIGPTYSRMGPNAAAIHEHGLSFKGQRFPQRPTMGPALSANISRFHSSFAGSIG
jgi:hypothetical protein